MTKLEIIHNPHFNSPNYFEAAGSHSEISQGPFKCSYLAGKNTCRFRIQQMHVFR